MATPKKNEAYEFFTVLTDSLDPAKFRVNPTIAAGDFRVSIDGGTLVNLATLPVVSPAGSRLVKVNLSAAEMDGDNISVVGVDVAGSEWEEYVDTFNAPTVNLESIAADVWTRVLEGTLTMEQAFRIVLSVLAGKSTATQAPFRFQTRDVADTKNRVDAFHSDDGDRTSVTLDGT